MDSPDAPPRRPGGLTRRLTGVRRHLLRRRRPLAVLLLGLAALAALRVLAPPEPATATLYVAARDLPAGRVVAADDLVAVGMPHGVVPEGVVDDPQGRVLAGAVRSGEPVTDVRLVGEGLATAQPDDTRAAPVRLSDAGQAALLSVGDRIDLFATDPESASTRPLAAGVTVLAVPGADRAADGALPGRLVVVALRSTEVHEVTAASVARYVTYTWSRG